MWIVRSASDASTIVVGVSYDQSMKASDFHIGENLEGLSESSPLTLIPDSKDDDIQAQMVVHEKMNAPHNDTSQKAPKQDGLDGYSDWEKNLKLETENTRARTEGWAKIAEGVLTFVRHYIYHANKIMLFSP